MLKKILTFILAPVILTTICGFLFMFGTKNIHLIIADFCFRLIPLVEMIILIWILWPYIKRGINYLVNHRED